MRRRGLIILSLAWCLSGAKSFSADQDSLRYRMYHGLDEMGAGASFFLDGRVKQFWHIWQGDFHSIYRRPVSSQGDLKMDGNLRGEIGRSLRRDLDLEVIFAGDFYQFEQFRGPERMAPSAGQPAHNWDLVGLSSAPSSPPQRISSPFLGMGSIFRPDSSVRITAAAGRRWDQREGFDDQGFSASLTAEMQDLIWGGYENNLNLFAQQEELGARLNQELRLQYGLDKEFSVSSSDRLAIHYRQKRHDYHIWGSAAIGTRWDTDQSFQNQLRYDLSRQLGFLLDSQVSGSRHEDRSVAGSAVREETNTGSALTLRAERGQMAGWLRLKFDWGAQEDATGLKRERGTSLEQGLTWAASARDSLNLAAAARKRQYDTSDTANYDDRDRLRYEIDLLYGHVFDEHFRASNRLQVILEHLVYIYGAKSDQNNWNRIFKLSPEVSFEPYLGWANLARFELAANFTDYDFELDPAFIKSTVYRRYSVMDSLAWAMARGWSMDLEYSLDLEDGGRLLWDDWVEQIAEEYRTHRAFVRLNRETPAGVRFAAGFSTYQRKGWQYTLEPSLGTVKSPFLFISRWGPVLQLSYPSNSGVSIEAAGDLSWVHQWGSEDYSIVNLDVRITWQ